jgi:hypothetical protein
MLLKWVDSLYRFLFKNREGLVLFVSGAVIAGIASGLLEKTITWSTATLVGILVVLVLSAVFLFAETSGRVQLLADAIEASVRFVEEPYRKEDATKYRGVLYEVLERLVRDAEFEIYALASGYKRIDKQHETDLHESRRRYLSAIEKNIERHKSGKFEYVRILQIDRRLRRHPISRIIGGLTADHCRKVVDLKKQFSELADIDLSVMAIDTQMTTSFIVIDRKYLVIEIDGLDSEGETYAAGLLVIEDRGKRIVDKFIRHFKSYQRPAQELKAEHFQQRRQGNPPPKPTNTSDELSGREE